MQSFWAFRRLDNGAWDLIEEEKFDELPDIITGSLRIVDTENRAKALEKVVGIEETIRRIFKDVNANSNKYAYHKWFGGGEEDA